MVDDVDKAREFYGETLGLNTSVENDLLTLHIAGDRPTLAYPRPDHKPAEYTILNFPVEDIQAAVDELVARGVEFERYEGFDQDDQGINRDGPRSPGSRTRPATCCPSSSSTRAARRSAGRSGASGFGTVGCISTGVALVERAERLRVSLERAAEAVQLAEEVLEAGRGDDLQDPARSSPAFQKVCHWSRGLWTRSPGPASSTSSPSSAPMRPSST